MFPTAIVSDYPYGRIDRLRIDKEVTVMAYKISDACVKCGSCAENCPVEAISEGEDTYVIDADVP